MLRELKKTELKNSCKHTELPFNTTDDISALKETIGQKRALSALEFGLDIDSHGFNIYILGESGTGKMTTIRNILEDKSKKEPAPKDWCYVYNFKDNDNPHALSLPPGKGLSFKKDMDEMISALQQEIPKIFDSKEYEKQKTSILDNFHLKQKEHFSSLEEEAKENKFTLRKTVSGLVLVPVKESGETMSEEEYEALEPKKKKQVETTGKGLQEKLDDAIRIVREEEKKIKEIIKDLERQATFVSVEHRIEDIRNTFKDETDVSAYLDEVEEDILNNLDDFKPQEEQMPAMPFMKPAKTEPSLNKYAVNVFVNNLDRKGAPVVIESNPTYYNLFGRVDHKLQYGMAMTDFTMIKPGALQRANGGYLVIDALELLKNIFAYDSLKRTIKDQEIKIEDVWEQYRQVSTITLRPEAIPYNVKIILVGSPQLYYMLYSLDEEYRELFKVKADYENRMNRNKENTLKYANFVQTKCAAKGLKPFNKGAVARVIEYGSRLAEHKNKLSAKFSDIADLLREADYWAKKNGNGIITAADIDRAQKERLYRVNKVENKILEATKEGTLLIQTNGAVTGQINGLAVIDLGDHRFGTPSRITARTYAGKAGIVNIERETKMSGKIHEKAIMTLTAYLGGTYARKQALSLTASITFEQLYGMIEGDSATCAEVYAILSSISGVPIKQSFAITGSMNQHGEVQPIGGVNEKIEGFYDLCKQDGLNGEHGVIIPSRNLINLMLNSEVIEAVAAKKFRIYAIDNIEDGIKILTGMAPGKLKANGTYPKNTFNFEVMKALEELSKALVPEKNDNDNGNGKKKDDDTSSNCGKNKKCNKAELSDA